MNTEAVSTSNLDPLIEQATELMNDLDPDPMHARQVCRIVLQLFDQLQDLHNLDGRQRIILEASALVHDIGWSIAGKKHHKHSARLIEDHPWKGVPRLQVLQMAATARYHRKALPKESHRLYGVLDDESRDRVDRMASLLRLADGLDRGHLAVVKEVRTQIQPGLCKLLVRSLDYCGEELAGARKKSDLFERVFKLPLQIEQVEQANP